MSYSFLKSEVGILTIFDFEYSYNWHNDSFQSTHAAPLVNAITTCSVWIFLTVAVVPLSKPKVVKPLHLLTAFHARVNWCRWPVKAAVSGKRWGAQEEIEGAFRGWSSLLLIALVGQKEQIPNAKFKRNSTDIYYAAVNILYLWTAVSSRPFVLLLNLF